MRPVVLGFRFFNEPFEQWAERALHDIENASIEDAMIVADAYTLTNLPTVNGTPTLTQQRTLDVQAGTLADVRNVLATFLNDLQKRSPNRVE